MSTVQRGILRVSDEMIAEAKAALPPEHQVIAERRLVEDRLVEWILEGPLMPDCKVGAEPPLVELIFSALQSPEFIVSELGDFVYQDQESYWDMLPSWLGQQVVTARFAHRPDREWTVPPL